MPNVYINPRTKKSLETLANDLPQSIVFTGPEGVGLTSAVTFVAELLKTKPIYVLPEKDEKIDVEKGVITVDIIRRLYSMTKTIEKGTRLIVIDYAERMGVQAQNAFLKLLEEPGKNTHFIIMTHIVSKLLPTIQSRVQVVEIAPITPQQSDKLLDEFEITDKTRRAQLLFIALGLPAQLTQLVTNEELFEDRAQIIRDARSYIQSRSYDRLRIAFVYKDDREKALMMLVDAMKLLQGSLKSGQNPEQVKKVSALLAVHERIEANGNVRTQLSSVEL
jgi:DNA polymerase III delta prime subunit